MGILSDNTTSTSKLDTKITNEDKMEDVAVKTLYEVFVDKIKSVIKEVFHIKEDKVYLEDKEIKNEVVQKEQTIPNYNEPREFVYISKHDEPLSRDNFQPIFNSEYFMERGKPDGGLWSSTYIPQYDKDSPFISDWQNYLMTTSGKYSPDNAPDTAYTFTVSEDANILYIDSLDKYNELLEQYRDDKFSNTLDYETLSKDYDGLYIDYQTASNNSFGDNPLKNWMVETMLVFNPDIVEWDDVKEVEIPQFNFDNEYFEKYANNMDMIQNIPMKLSPKKEE